MPILETRSEIKVTVTQGHYALYNKRPNTETKNLHKQWEQQ